MGAIFMFELLFSRMPVKNLTGPRPLSIRATDTHTLYKIIITHFIYEVPFKPLKDTSQKRASNRTMDKNIQVQKTNNIQSITKHTMYNI